MSKSTALMPRLRFPKFRDAGEWEKKRLGDNDFCEVNPPSGGLPERFIYVDLESVVSGELVLEKEILKNGAPSRAQRLLKNGDVIYQMVRPYQKNNYHFDIETKVAYVASTGYAQLRPVGSSEFVFQLIHTEPFVNSVLGKCTGSNYPAIRATDLAQIGIEIPSSPEQQKIADCLTSVDDLITAEAQKLEALKDHKKGLMQQLFPRENETKPRLRFPQFHNAGEWEEKSLGACLRQHPDYGKNAPAVPYSENLPAYLRITDISEEGRFVSDQKVSVAQAVSEDDYLQDGDIALARTGASVGKSYRHNDTNGKLVFAGFLIRVRTDESRLLSELLIHFLSTAKYWRWVDFISARSGQPGINGHEYASLPVPLPPSLEEQQKVADILASIDELITAEAQKIKALKDHKKGLMQQLFPASDEVNG